MYSNRVRVIASTTVYLTDSGISIARTSAKMISFIWR